MMSRIFFWHFVAGKSIRTLFRQEVLWMLMNRLLYNMIWKSGRAIIRVLMKRRYVILPESRLIKVLQERFLIRVLNCILIFLLRFYCIANNMSHLYQMTRFFTSFFNFIVRWIFMTVSACIRKIGWNGYKWGYNDVVDTVGLLVFVSGTAIFFENFLYLHTANTSIKWVVYVLRNFWLIILF